MAHRQDGDWILTESEYAALLADSRFLDNLRAAGVDNWEGYYYGYYGYDEDED
jgi:hypothetical protein